MYKSLQTRNKYKLKMVLIEEFAEVVEIRPGRRIFLRKVLLGCSQPDSLSTSQKHIQMIFVHGLCGTEQQYQLLLDSLDKLMSSASSEFSKLNYCASCFLYDSIGCGQSPPLYDWNAYSNEEMRADFEAIVTLKYLNETVSAPSLILPTILVGHSYAPSMFLPLVAARRDGTLLLPNLIGLIFINTAVRGLHFHIPDGGHAVMRLPVFILRCIQSSLTEGFIKIAIHPEHVDLRNEIRKQSQHNDMRVAQAYHRHMEWAHLSHLQNAIWRSNDKVLPTLTIHGAKDELTPVECAQYIHNHLLPTQKSDLVIIDRACHLVMLEQPEQTAKAVLTFLEKLLKAN
jgi:pimeloyl-ACP methyl ester carboxylesterase